MGSSPKEPRTPKIRSRFLLGDNPGFRDYEPFRQNFIMQFPPREQRALHLLAEMLHYKEDLVDEHLPLFRGSHNLAELRAAALDLQSIARSLAAMAACIEEEISEREVKASVIADRFAVKIARIAREIEAAMDEITPPRRQERRAENRAPAAEPWKDRP